MLGRGRLDCSGNSGIVPRETRARSRDKAGPGSGQRAGRGFLKLPRIRGCMGPVPLTYVRPRAKTWDGQEDPFKGGPCAGAFATGGRSWVLSFEDSGYLRDAAQTAENLEALDHYAQDFSGLHIPIRFETQGAAGPKEGRWIRARFANREPLRGLGKVPPWVGRPRLGGNSFPTGKVR